MALINGLIWLLACQFAGEFIKRATDVPVPGPVIGMVLLLGALMARQPAAGSSVFRVADALLEHLQLLFIPAGVGVVVYLSAIEENALPIAVALVVSWLAGLVTVAALITLLSRRTTRARR